MKKKINTKIIITGLVCLTIIELFALSRGINGVLLSTVFAIIAGVIGWTAPQLKVK
jgi:hypothetical protein